MELILPCRQLRKDKRTFKETGKGEFQTGYQKYFFSQRVLSRWNRLSEDVISAQSVDTFKRRLEEFGRKKKDFFKDYKSAKS